MDPSSAPAPVVWGQLQQEEPGAGRSSVRQDGSVVEGSLQRATGSSSAVDSPQQHLAARQLGGTAHDRPEQADTLESAATYKHLASIDTGASTSAGSAPASFEQQGPRLRAAAASDNAEQPGPAAAPTDPDVSTSGADSGAGPPYAGAAPGGQAGGAVPAAEARAAGALELSGEGVGDGAPRAPHTSADAAGGLAEHAAGRTTSGMDSQAEALPAPGAAGGGAAGAGLPGFASAANRALDAAVRALEGQVRRARALRAKPRAQSI